MIEIPTVLILGAGASMGFQYPSGIGLKEKVIEITKHQNSEPYHCLLSLKFNQQIINVFRDALFYSGKSSVDAFLEYRPKYIDVGKAAIALVLIQLENKNTLFKDSKSWYGYLFERMGAEFEDFIENQIGIVTFNYDRSLETYLFNALMNTYGKKGKEVANILSNIPIVHVHGKLGDLPWQSPNGRSYKPTYDSNLIKYSAEGIRIISEESQVNPAFGNAHKIIKESERVIFLGFGYNKTNIDRLNLDVGQHSKHHFFGTNFGLTPLESQEIERLFDGRINLRQVGFTVKQYLREKVTL